MKTFLLLMLSSFTFVAFGQIAPDSGLPDAIIQAGFTNKEEAKNEKISGVKDGKWMEEGDNGVGKYYQLLIYKAGKVCGIARTYNMKGILMKESHFTDGVENGIEKIYGDKGNVVYETPYTNGKKNGTEKVYNDQGKLAYEIPFQDEKQNGVEKVYNTAGGILYEIPYENGNINGVEKGYTANGKPLTETTYSNGKAGTIKNYDDNSNNNN